MTFPFTKDRYVHALLERDGDVCLVERTNQLTKSVHWEVVILEPRHARTLPNGEHAAAHVAYPSPNKWGVFGWTYTRLTDARQKYAELLRRGGQKGGSQAKAIA